MLEKDDRACGVLLRTGMATTGGAWLIMEGRRILVLSLIVTAGQFGT